MEIKKRSYIMAHNSTCILLVILYSLMFSSMVMVVSGNHLPPNTE
jgi:hypothetical protein